MLSLFKNTKKIPVKVQVQRKDLIETFYQKTEHAWIQENKYIHGNFEDFFEYIPSALLFDIVETYDILFVPISGKYSCAISSANVILVFPDLLELLSSTALSNYKAILGHEIGHILLKHGSKSLSVLEAQVEADEMAIMLGFGQDLESFLLELPESIEKRLRLSYLTSKYYNRNM